MRTISAFNFLTLNGYYKGANHDISWHQHGDEGREYSEKQLESNNILLFGRKTYEIMNSFWPTKMAYDMYPKIAEKMNNAEKIVLSNSQTNALWNNTKILSGNAIDQIRQLKNTPGKNITILGSGSVITQLSENALIDEYEFWIDPLAIGTGTSVFENIKVKIELTIKDCILFPKSGAVLLKYSRKQPAIPS